MNLAWWLARAGQSVPTAAAIDLGETPWCDYRQFAARSAALAAWLRACGLVPGDRVALVAPNCPEYLVALYGIWWAGLTAVPVNARLHPRELAWILDHCGARIVLASQKIADSMESGTGRVLCLDSGEFSDICRSGEEPVPHATAPGDLAWLFYTSGTTGKPKGAMLTHRNLMAMALACLAVVDPGTGPGSPLLHAAPLSHGSGLYALHHLAVGGRNVIVEPESAGPADIARLCGVYPQASMFAAPTMIQRLVRSEADFPAPPFRRLIWGGAPMLAANVEQALDRFGPCLAQIYGQGETPMTTSFLTSEEIADRTHADRAMRIRSAGRINPVVEVAILDEQDVPLPAGSPGEIAVRGDTVMAGYWRDPEASAQALRGGWLHTGDVGVLDPGGYLTLQDRARDLIVSGGMNIYPREVEEALSSAAGIDEVSVIGRPDAEWGEIVVAYLVAGTAGPPPVEDLDAHCRGQIARFKRPRDYIFVAELPKNSYGKILKRSLRELDRTQAGRTPES